MIKNTFYRVVRKQLKEQMLLNESLEGLQKKYVPIIMKMANNYGNLQYSGSDDGGITEDIAKKVIKFLFDLDPTKGKKSGEEFAKKFITMHLNYILGHLKKGNGVFIDEGLFNAREVVQRYLELVKTMKDENIKFKIKSLNNFDTFHEIDVFNAELRRKIESIAIRRQTKGFNKAPLIYKNDDWEVRLFVDKDMFQNTFEGWSDWCISKSKQDWWEQYTGQEYLTQENARPGIPIVFRNLRDDYKENNELNKWICVIIAYDDEEFWEFRDRKDNISEYKNEILSLESKIVEELKNMYGVNSILEIGREEFDEINGDYAGDDYEEDGDDDGILMVNGREYESYIRDDVFNDVSTDGRVANIYGININEDYEMDFFNDFIVAYYIENFVVGNDIKIASENENLYLDVKLLKHESEVYFKNIGDLEFENIGTSHIKKFEIDEGYNIWVKSKGKISVAYFLSTGDIIIDDTYIADMVVDNDCDIELRNKSLIYDLNIFNKFPNFIGLDKDAKIENIITHNIDEVFIFIDTNYLFFGKDIEVIIYDHSNSTYNRSRNAISTFDLKHGIQSLKITDELGMDYIINLDNEESLKELIIESEDEKEQTVTIVMKKDVFDKLDKFEGDINKMELI